MITEAEGSPPDALPCKVSPSSVVLFDHSRRSPSTRTFSPNIGSALIERPARAPGASASAPRITEKPSARDGALTTGGLPEAAVARQLRARQGRARALPVRPDRAVLRREPGVKPV